MIDRIRHPEDSSPIEPNAGRVRRIITVTNASERPVRVSSHYPFHRVNGRLRFDRDAARGFRLDLPSGDTVRWAPGEALDVTLVAYGGEGGAP